MPLEWTINHPHRLVTVTVAGVTDPADVEHYLAEIAAAGGMPYRKIIDLTFAPGEARLADLKVMMRTTEHYAKTYTLGALAIVVDHWPQYFTDKHEAVYVAGFTHIDAFAFGALINLMPAALCARLGRGPVILAATAVAILLGWVTTGTMAGALWFSPTDVGAQLIWGYTAVDVVCMLLICRAVSRPTDSLGRATAPMAVIGRWSYSFYLIHLPIIFMGSRSPSVLGLDVPGWLLLVIAVGLTLGIARTLYEWVEKPALRLRSRFATA